MDARLHRHVFVAAASPVFPAHRAIIACRRCSFAFARLARILSAGSDCPSSSRESTMAGGIPERQPHRHCGATSHFGNYPRQFSLCLGCRNWLCVYRARPACSSRAPPRHDLLTYPDRTLRVPKGWSVLEASLRYNVPHASACGGKARCSTCRIRVLGDRSGLPRPSPREVFVLDRVGAIGDPAIRLACQLRPQGTSSWCPFCRRTRTPHSAMAGGRLIPVRSVI